MSLTLDDLRQRTVITVPELAEVLAIGRNEAYAALAAGEIPGGLRLGRSWRIAVPALLAWLGEAPERDEAAPASATPSGTSVMSHPSATTGRTLASVPDSA